MLHLLARTTVLALTLATGVAASAASPNYDFGITDDFSLAVFRDAVHSSEYVRFDYTSSPNPRTVAVTAGILEFATRNPIADEQAIATFASAYDAVLTSYFPNDPTLSRPTNFVEATRFARVSAVPALEGFDTNVGESALEMLGVSITEPRGFEALQRRVVEYERARLSSFSSSSEFSGLLMLGFAGRNLDGELHPGIAQTLETYLEGQGYEATPDGVDDARFNPINNALGIALPPNYAVHTSRLADPTASGLWTETTAQITAVNDETELRLIELGDALAVEPTLIEGVGNAADPAKIAAAEARYLSRVGAVAPARAVIAGNAMLMMQSADGDIRKLAQETRDYSEIQLQTNEVIAGVTEGVAIVGGIAQAAAGAAMKDPASAIEGVTNAVTGALGLADVLGASGPSVEEQIFDEMVETRQQIEDMRVQMNERFDRIETQINLVYTTLSDGFNAIGNQIGDLQLSVDDLTRLMVSAKTDMERIEDSLWGVAEALILQDLVDDVNVLLGYRILNGSDLPYDLLTPNFVSGASDFFGFTTTTAKSTVFAGDDPSTLTIENAASRLDSPSIGRNLNDLRVFPVQIGLPALSPVRVVGPAAWSQGATAYAQLAQESPWYFAFMYQQQLLDVASTPRLDQIISAGESLTAMFDAGRNQALFDELFSRYAAAIQAAQTTADAIRDSHLQNIELHMINPWGGIAQEGQDLRSGIAPFSMLEGINNLDDLPLPSNSTDSWDIYGQSTQPELGYHFSEDWANRNGNTIAVHTHRLHAFDDRDESRGPNSVILEIVTKSVDFENPSVVIANGWRAVRFELWANGTDVVGVTGDPWVEAWIENDIIVWPTLRADLLSGQNLKNSSTFFVDGNGVPMEIRYKMDRFINNVDFPINTFVTTRMDEIQDEIWDLIRTDPNIIALSEYPDNYEALIEAYATMSLPELFEQSAVSTAGMRSNPATGELSLAFGQSLTDLYTSFAGAGDNGEYPDLYEIMASHIDPQTGQQTGRAAIVQNDINDALSSAPVGHGYIDWTLAELRELRGHAFRLAVDDAFITGVDGTLVVGAADGLLGNDVDQAFRNIQVDTAFVLEPEYVAPQNGVVTVFADGSFEYIPNPAFEGTDSFTYRSFTDVGSSTRSTPSPYVFSDPATVVVHVSASIAACPADMNSDGVVDGADLAALLTQWGGPGGADLDQSGTVDGADLAALLAAWGACQ